MTENERKCTRCGEPRAADLFKVKTFTRPYGKSQRRITQRYTVCTPCLAGAQSIAKRARDKARLSVEKVRCIRCGDEKTRTTVNFSLKQGSLDTVCRDCQRQWVKAYRRTKKYKDWLVRTRERRTAKRLARNRTPAEKLRSYRYMLRTRVSKATEKRRANRFHDAVENKLIVRPSLCELCGARAPLQAYFPFNSSDSLAAIFLCHPDSYEIRELVKRRQAGEKPQDEAEGMKELHALNVIEAVARERTISTRTKKANRYYSPKRRLHERRRVFLVYECGYSDGEATRAMEREGWFRKGHPPLDLVLGMWVPYICPQTLAARSRASERELQVGRTFAGSLYSAS